MIVGDEPAQRPEGRLIQEAAERRNLSARKLAPLAGISEGRWRQIVNGYQSLGGAGRIAVVGPPLTVARMALAVGVDADQLRRADREDAASALERLAEEPRVDATVRPGTVEARAYVPDGADVDDVTDADGVDGVVRSIIVILNSRYSNDTKISAIRDVIESDYRPAAESGVADNDLPQRAAG